MAASNHLSSVERVMKVLNCFTLETPELRLTDISERVGMHKTQVLRIVSTLEAGGYLARDRETKRYRLGLQVFQLGMVVRQQTDLRRLTNPYLHRLVRETGETVRLVVPDEAGPVCLDVVESPHGLRVYAQLGARMPWNAGTSAKVILAFLPETQREAILARGGFKKFTPRTKTDADELREDLELIRQRGYHAQTADLTEDTCGIAAPLFKEHGEIAGAISLTAPASRLKAGDEERYIQLVRETAEEISLHLGYRHRPSTPGAF